MPAPAILRIALSALAPFICIAAAIEIGHVIALAMEWSYKLRRCTAVAAAVMTRMDRYGTVGRGDCLCAATFRVHFPGRRYPSEFIIASRGRKEIGPSEQNLYYDPDDPDRHYMSREKPDIKYWARQAACVLVLTAAAAVSALCRAGIL